MIYFIRLSIVFLFLSPFNFLYANEENLIKKALTEIENKNYFLAKSTLNEFLNRYSSRVIAGDVHFLLASIHLAENQKNKAIESLVISIRDYPKSSKIGESHQMLLDILIEQNKIDLACAVSNSSYLKNNEDSLSLFSIMTDLRYWQLDDCDDNNILDQNSINKLIQ